MESQFNFRFEIEMELELIKVDPYGLLDSFDHFGTPMGLF